MKVFKVFGNNINFKINYIKIYNIFKGYIYNCLLKLIWDKK